jgi:hypothetical protein
VVLPFLRAWSWFVALPAWAWLGALPALPLVVGFFVLAGAATLALGPTAATAVGVALVAALLAYCVARPTGGTDLFLVVGAPNAGWQLLHDTFDAPTWVFFALLPIALIGAWSVDHGADDEDAGTADEDAGAADTHRDAGTPGTGAGVGATGDQPAAAETPVAQP